VVAVTPRKKVLWSARKEFVKEFGSVTLAARVGVHHELKFTSAENCCANRPAFASTARWHVRHGQVNITASSPGIRQCLIVERALPVSE
jgi:hypothetical protein